MIYNVEVSHGAFPADFAAIYEILNSAILSKPCRDAQMSRL